MGHSFSYVIRVFDQRRQLRLRQRHKARMLLVKQENTRAARATRISMHFSAVLHKKTTWNYQILGFDDNLSV